MNIKALLRRWAWLFAGVFVLSLLFSAFRINVAAHRGAVIATAVAVALFSVFIGARRQALPNDPDERLRVMTQRYAAGRYKNDPLRLNALSVLYYTRREPERALALSREASGVIAAGRWARVGSASPQLPELCRLNEAVFLIELGRPEEARDALDAMDEKRCRKSPSVTHNLYTVRAQIAIAQGDSAAARERLRQAREVYSQLAPGTPENRANTEGHLLLLEARCDLLEHDTATAAARLDEVLATATWPPTLEKAAALRDIAALQTSAEEQAQSGVPPL